MGIIAIIALVTAFYVAACQWPVLWCHIGMHRWDEPGGHCEDCGFCDTFFGPHEHDLENNK